MNILYEQMYFITKQLEKKGITKETIRYRNLLKCYYEVLYDLHLIPEWQKFFEEKESEPKCPESEL